jgi:hypothetical protein
MRTLCLKIDDTVYGILLAMLKGLPKDKVEIIGSAQDQPAADESHARSSDLMQYAGSIQWPVDGVAYQRQIRDEEEDCTFHFV